MIDDDNDVVVVVVAVASVVIFSFKKCSLFFVKRYND